MMNLDTSDSEKAMACQHVWLKMNQSLIVASTRRPNQAFLSRQGDQHMKEAACCQAQNYISQ